MKTPTLEGDILDDDIPGVTPLYETTSRLCYFETLRQFNWRCWIDNVAAFIEKLSTRRLLL